jgi:hypothetical protein
MSGQNLIPSEALEGLMRKAFIDGDVEAGLFWDAFIKSNVYVPLSQPTGEMKTGRQKADGLEEFPVLLGVDSKGTHVLWLFTSPAVMLDYTERDLPYLELSATTVLNNVRDSEHEVVLIGPERLTLSLHPDLISSLADGNVPEPVDKKMKTVPKEAEVQVGPVQESTLALEERFKELFDSESSVLEATFIEVADDSGPRLLLGMRLSDESKANFRHIAALIAKASEGVLGKGKTMDITLINGSLKGAFEKYGKPFFQR